MPFKAEPRENRAAGQEVSKSARHQGSKTNCACTLYLSAKPRGGMTWTVDDEGSHSTIGSLRITLYCTEDEEGCGGWESRESREGGGEQTVFHANLVCTVHTCVLGTPALYSVTWYPCRGAKEKSEEKRGRAVIRQGRMPKGRTKVLPRCTCVSRVLGQALCCE